MRALRFFGIWFALACFAMGQGRGIRVSTGSHRTTAWNVQPSLKYDALCALNFLSGDPFYLKFYQADYDRLAPLLSPAEKREFVALKQIIKDQNQGIVSASLALILSTQPGDSLDDLLAALDRPNEIRERLRSTPYYSPANFQVFLQARPHVAAAIRALRRIRFDRDWQQNIRPQIEERAAQLEPQLQHYNIVPLQEQVLGHALPTDRIDVYLLYYSQPHGIKITGTRYLTHFAYPFDIVLHNAVHEMLHPPYNLKDPQTLRAIETLRANGYLMNKVEHHDPSLGYNEFEGFVEEDCVQALEQAITKHMGLQESKQDYWRRQDGGMHVLAIGLYVLMQREDYMRTGEPFPSFLRRMAFSGQLTERNLVALNREFYGTNSTR